MTASTASLQESVVLVDENDRELGTAEKLQAHLDGQLHRAFSVFVFDRQGRTMLQQRALHKYHSPGLWSNTCCSHQRPGEATPDAAHRRLNEEMGFDCPVEPAFEFVYKVELQPGLFEHEYDHVLIGYYDGDADPNPEEVADWKWVDPSEVAADLNARPELYSHWFGLVFGRAVEAYRAMHSA
ncbi:MAG: isopentenyl-diphosphate Delta-isomerase [Bacteroidota bacterium]